MNRILDRLGVDVQLSALNGGGLRNAIPRESNAVVVFDASTESNVVSTLEAVAAEIKVEYRTTDASAQVLWADATVPAEVLSIDFKEAMISAIYACPNGIYRMSPDIEGLVQTSNNLARVAIENGQLVIMCLTRSAVETEKMDLARAIERNFAQMGCAVELSGNYPGWTPNPSSAILTTMRELYVEMFKEQPHVAACHAGLECGILGTNYPDMELISFGPNIRGAHSPDEKCQISSVQKSWEFFLNTLENIPTV